MWGCRSHPPSWHSLLKVRCKSEVTIDAKGRLTLPAKIRGALDELPARPGQLVVGPDPEGCLLAWVPDHFDEKLGGRVEAGDPLDPDLRDWAYGNVVDYEDLEIDPSGRINLPKNMRDQAGLTRDCVVFVLLGRIEIWDRERWQARSAQAQAAPKRAAPLPSGRAS